MGGLRRFTQALFGRTRRNYIIGLSSFNVLDVSVIVVFLSKSVLFVLGFRFWMQCGPFSCSPFCRPKLTSVRRVLRLSLDEKLWCLHDLLLGLLPFRRLKHSRSSSIHFLSVFAIDRLENSDSIPAYLCPKLADLLGFFGRTYSFDMICRRWLSVCVRHGLLHDSESTWAASSDSVNLMSRHGGRMLTQDSLPRATIPLQPHCSNHLGNKCSLSLDLWVSCLLRNVL